ncbi:MAG TPA: S8 family serine peptidase [Ornithinicoccus sp.]|nr:S8 family serine peptidase [Ornithinicoccus sp.]
MPERPHGVSTPRPRARLAHALLALPLVVPPLALGVPATADPGGAAPAAGAPGWVTDAAGDGTAAHEVTLITGDTVRVATAADGTRTVTVEPRPGAGPGFWTHEIGDDLYVVPQDVAPLVPDRLDPELFNVSLLAELGSTDGPEGVPVILGYDEGHRAPAATTLGEDPVRLDSVNGVAVEVDEDDSETLLAALGVGTAGDQAARRADPGPLRVLEKIWLDRPVEAVLDRSVPQIGADEAWELGLDGTGVTVAVLDSGIDLEHPDLADRVVDSVNFSASDTVDDRHGHGTHVASTIAGSGAASGGRYVGVAPGAELLNVKVLDDVGSGTTSGVIAGMEWAAEHGADIVNMSLGERGNYSDGTDPASTAVNALTEEHGTLFVVAAGNDGPRDGTVTSPATADLALTVGSVDRDESIAETSSRGPRTGDHAIKPEITAPGVDIVAARAEGSGLGFPLDDHYMYLSGTSMAAPHVAGAAALVLQDRPELGARELKGVLVGSASPNPDLRVLDQGAGRVDVPAALGTALVAEPVALQLGQWDYPHPVLTEERTITYRNLGDEDLVVDLAATATNPEGEPAADGALTVSPATLTVPAGGTAEATVTLETGAVAGVGHFSGAVTATAENGARHATPLAFYLEPERYDVHIEGIARDGRPAYGTVQVLDVEDGSVAAVRTWGDGTGDSCTTEVWDMSSCIRLEPGTYSVSGIVLTMPPGRSSTAPPTTAERQLNTSLLVEPELTVTGETTVTLDARDAVEVEFETPGHPTRQVTGSAAQVSLSRVAETGETISHGLLIGPRDQVEPRWFVQPTDQVDHGELTAYSQVTLDAPDITFRVEGSPGTALDPRYYDPYWFSDHSWQFPRLDGEQRLRVVDAGAATPEELAGLDLDGALALVRRSPEIPVADQSNNAAAAGAALVAVVDDATNATPHPGSVGTRLEVPTVRLTAAEGERLLGALRAGPVHVLATGEPVSPYRYHVRVTDRGGISADQRHVLDDDDLATVRNRFHAQLDATPTLTETWFAKAPWEGSASGWPVPTLGGSRERVDYYVADPDLAYAQHVDSPEGRYNWLFPEDDVVQLRLASGFRTFAPGEQVERSWMAGPLRPEVRPEDPVVRRGDLLDLHLAAFADGDGHRGDGWTSPFEDGLSTNLRVLADGEEVLETTGPVDGTLGLPPGAEDLRLEYTVANDAPWAQLSTRTRSVWTFGSGTTEDGAARVEPLLTVDYELDVGLDNRLPGTAERRGPLTFGFRVSHQDGAAAHPIVTGTLEISYDGGLTWRAVPQLREVGDGSFQAHLPARIPKENDGTLSFRITATDEAGNGIEQEVVRAVGLWESR